MSMLRYGAIVLSLAAASWMPAGATTVSYTGTFSQDDDIAIFGFSLASNGPAMLRTWSYNGGVNGAGQVVLAGGFDPVISVYDSLGNLAVFNDDGGSPLDSYIEMTFAAGAYTVFLTQSDNLPAGLTLGDGFSQAGNPSFTSSYGCTNGQFCDFMANDRTNFWALDIVTAETPEPSTMLLLAGPLAALLVRRRR